MDAPIVFEKTYYYPTYFDDSFRDGKPTGKWHGILLVRTYQVRKHKSGNHLHQCLDAIDFGGQNQQQMDANLAGLVEGKEELEDENPKVIPRSLRPVLKQYGVRTPR